MGSIPQGEYVSATANLLEDSYSCAYLAPQTGPASGYDLNQVPQTPAAAAVAVNLPAPIDITGSSTVLLLDLLVSKSVSWNPSGVDCTPANGTESITPAFTLRQVSLPSAQAGSGIDSVTGLEGAAVPPLFTAGGFNFLPAGLQGPAFTGAIGPVWSVNALSGATFQGISSLSQLALGQPLDIDASLQPDGSLAATRIEVLDPDTSNLGWVIGPLVFVGSANPTLISVADQTDVIVDPTLPEGLTTWSGSPGIYIFNSSNSVLQISGQFHNLQSLPFSPVFTPGTIVPGQQVFVSNHSSLNPSNALYPVATRIVLMPQTLNGTVTAVSNDGDFTVYTVTLAPYDVFSQMAVQPGQNTLLTNPNTVYVYADSNAHMLNTSTVNTGGVFRFYGLVFNDNGTLRMDCTQVNDGVPE